MGFGNLGFETLSLDVLRLRDLPVGSLVVPFWDYLIGF